MNPFEIIIPIEWCYAIFVSLPVFILIWSFFSNLPLETKSKIAIAVFGLFFAWVLVFTKQSNHKR